MVIILDGKALQKERSHAMREYVSACEHVPTLLVIQVGDKKASSLYIKRKREFASSLGINTIHTILPDSVTEDSVIDTVYSANSDKNIDGIIVQLPLPSQLNVSKIINQIDPEKDVDGLTAVNMQRLMDRSVDISTFSVPATALGILSLLRHYDVSMPGKKVTVVGRSQLVGLSTALLLLRHDATVTVCHSKTHDIRSVIHNADIIVVAAGSPNLITSDMVQSHHVIIDVGITATDKGVAGDVDFVSVSPKVAMISPVPGGVGPMTVLSIFENLLAAHKRRGL